jgi:hypothetical protein
VRYRLAWLIGDAPEAATEEQVLARSKAPFAAMLDKVPSGPGQLAVGVWFGRSGKKALVALAVANVNVELDPMPFTPDADGTVVVSGTLPGPTARLEALVTRGGLDYAECSADPAVKLPRFSLRCPANRDDLSARVNLYAFPPGQILGMLTADLLVFPHGKGTSSYVRPALRPGPGAPEDDAGRFTFLLNGLRAELGLKPVVVSAGQSRVAQRVAPHYYASMYGPSSPKVADLVALGMMAGWEVDQVTHGAYFTEAVTTGDVSAMLAEMMDSPGARRALFEPSVRTLAFGSFRVPARDVLAAVVTTYAPFEERPPGEEARQVVDVLNRMRAERGLGPAQLVALPADVRAGMDQALAAGGSVRDAVQKVLERSVQLTRQSVSGASLETGSLKALEFPEEMLRRPALVVFVAMTHYRPPGLPWGVYVVGMAYAAQTGETVARSDGAFDPTQS